jgi:hypothetical protein
LDEMKKTVWGSELPSAMNILYFIVEAAVGSGKPATREPEDQEWCLEEETENGPEDGLNLNGSLLRLLFKGRVTGDTMTGFGNSIDLPFVALHR